MVVNARAITQALAEAANDCMTKKYKDGYKAEDFEYVYKYMV
jgi:hypothetical protein